MIELRREGLSVYEISARLRAGAPRSTAPESGRSSPRRASAGCCAPAPEASASPATAGRDTRLPRAAVIDFAAFPARAETSLTGLLLAAPGPGIPRPACPDQGGYPGTSVIPAISWLLSLLALKLTGTRRISHVDGLLTDPPAPCSPGWPSCRRNQPSPATPGGCPTTTSRSSWPPSIRR